MSMTDTKISDLKVIKNRRTDYQTLGTWKYTQVMHKLGPSAGRTTNAEYDNYTFHPDPEINAAAREFTKDNLGRSSWQVHGELYAENLFKMRELEKKMGILINEPTEEMLKKSATLRDAYNKYKFVEKMTLGR
jgi:hypothetical protein